MPHIVQPTPPADSDITGQFRLGTIILTLDGAIPIEFLSPGDRVITRAGARVLRAVTGSVETGFDLTFDQPEIVYTDSDQIKVA